MTRHVALAVILGASTLATAQYADSQPSWGRPATPRSGACFYRDSYFRGDYFCARQGENVPLLSGGMNQVSSIRAFGETEVTIFQDQGFRGRWTRLNGDVRDLRREGWTDRLSSIRVSSVQWRDLAEYGGRYGDPQNGSSIGRIETQQWQDDRGNQEGRLSAGSYESTRYGRTPSGADHNNPTAFGRRAGETADVVVRRSYQEVLQREPDARSLAFYRNRINNEHWSEQNVREALLNGSEYRQRITVPPQQSAEQLVARSYRSVLGREPDPASRVYVDKVMQAQWTEADVSRELRKSPEYRQPVTVTPQQNAEQVVARAYRSVLGREPDPASHVYVDKVMQAQWTEADVSRELRKSPEYRQPVTVTPQQNAEQVVARAYRSVLGREPDPASHVYVDKVMREHWTEADVSRELRNSPEYRNKHPQASRP